MNKFDLHKNKILEFIKKEKIGVLATVDKSKNPSCATMVVSQTDNLELIFQTHNGSRKYKNLKIIQM